MPGDFHGCHFVVPAYVLGDSCRYAWYSCFFPWHAVGHPGKRLDRGRYRIGIQQTGSPRAVAMPRHRAVVSAAKAASLIDCRVRIGIVSRRYQTDERFGDLILDHDVVVLHCRFIRSQQTESSFENPMLERRVARHTEGAAEREVAEKPSGRRRVVELLADRTNGNRRDAGRFEDVGERTNCTRAQWSYRCQQDDIDLFLLQERSTCRSAIQANAGQIKLIAGIGEMDL